jgi:hypothetical protein
VSTGRNHDWGERARAAALAQRVSAAALTDLERRSAERIAAAELAADRLLRQGDSKAAFSANGAYLPSRRAVHQRLLASLAVPASPSGFARPRAFLIGGAPCAGKTTLVQQRADLRDAVHISVERVLERLSAASDQAAYYLREASDLADAWFIRAIAMRQHLVYEFWNKDPGSADGGDALCGALGWLAALRAAGYHVRAINLDLEGVEAINRTLARFLDGGPYVPLTYLKAFPSAGRTRRGRG